MYAQQPYQYLPGYAIPVGQPMPTAIVPTPASAIPTRTSAGFGDKSRISNDTSSKDPELLKARVFIGNVNSNQCTRSDLIDLCYPYGNLKALSLVKGYAFVQYETQAEAEVAIKILNGYMFFGQKLDVRLAAIGKGSSVSATSNTGPVRRPKHDFLFGGQRIRVETTNLRNRTFSQDVYGILKDIKLHDHGKDDTIICGSCRSIFTTVNSYIEHRRQKKCQFFEKDVAPSVVSCFTCKEEFNEPWLFIQHLIHRHSINLYRGQPESDPISYNAGLKVQKGTEEKSNESVTAETQQQQNTTNNGETEKPTEAGTNQPVNNGSPKTANDTQQATDDVVFVTKKEPEDEEIIEVNQASADKTGLNEGTSASVESDMPSYSSAISIGLSSGNPATYVPASSSYMTSIPSFNVQAPPTFPTQPIYPTYQFTQPLVSVSSMQPAGYPTAPYVSSSIPSAPQISLPQFMAQSSKSNQREGGLSEEEQLKLLSELNDL